MVNKHQLPGRESVLCVAASGISPGEVASEPCNRGSKKGSHKSLVFLEETTGVPTADRLTNTKLYDVSYKELLSSATPGRTPSRHQEFLWQSSALGSLVVDAQAAVYLRTFAWWLLLQNWATLRGIETHTVSVHAGSLRALLTRSKKIG